MSAYASPHHERVAALVDIYTPLVTTIARGAVLDRVLAHAIAQEALVAVLALPDDHRTSARVIDLTRRIATEAAIRFARATDLETHPIRKTA